MLNEVDGDTKSNLFNILASHVQNTVCTDPTKWNAYVLKPLQVAGSPSSPFYESMGDVIHMQLEKEIEFQHPDGYWEPNWSWFGRYDETWPVAEKEWRGILTLEMLRILNSYQYLDIWHD
ncbi:hypothetical protein CN378_09375 [Bacillus sp. AFS015802]|nr:hypothetical protein CN378_09375 [Bacillus sp. AFS015802]